MKTVGAFEARNHLGHWLELAEKGEGARAEWVMVSEVGEGMRTPRRWFEAGVRAAKLPAFTWHCLRHTFASRLVMMGVDLRTVQELMGHKDIRMTCRYAHLSPGHKLEAVALLARWGQKTANVTGTTAGTDQKSRESAAPGSAVHIFANAVS